MVPEPVSLCPAARRMRADATIIKSRNYLLIIKDNRNDWFNMPPTCNVSGHPRKCDSDDEGSVH